MITRVFNAIVNVPSRFRLSDDALRTWLRSLRRLNGGDEYDCVCDRCEAPCSAAFVFISDGRRSGDPFVGLGYNGHSSGGCLGCVRRLKGLPRTDADAYAAAMTNKLS